MSADETQAYMPEKWELLPFQNATRRVVPEFKQKKNPPLPQKKYAFGGTHSNGNTKDEMAGIQPDREH